MDGMGVDKRVAVVVMVVYLSPDARWQTPQSAPSSHPVQVTGETAAAPRPFVWQVFVAQEPFV